MSLWKIFKKSATPKEDVKPKGITIETPRLILREHSLSDADKIHEMTSADGFKYYCFDGTREKVDAFLKQAIDTQTPNNKTGKRSEILLAITLKETGELIGHVSLEPVSYVEKFGYELNFFVDMTFQSKGYGREAAVNLMRYGLEDMGLPGYTVTTHPKNAASKHVILTEGYKQIDEIEMKTLKGSEPRLLFILTKDDFYKKRLDDKRPLLLPVNDNKKPSKTCRKQNPKR